jgi:hypothetical protein
VADCREIADIPANREKVAPAKSADGRRLVRSPVETTAVADQPVSNPADPETRSSSSYSMEFEDEEEDRDEVKVVGSVPHFSNKLGAVAFHSFHQIDRS